MKSRTFKFDEEYISIIYPSQKLNSLDISSIAIGVLQEFTFRNKQSILYKSNSGLPRKLIVVDKSLILLKLSEVSAGDKLRKFISKLSLDRNHGWAKS